MRKRSNRCDLGSADLQVSAACFLPFYFGIGDHCGILLDIPTVCLAGVPPKSIGLAHAGRLICNRTAVWGNYNASLETYSCHHRLQSRIDRIHHLKHTLLSSQYCHALNSVDRVLGEGMRSSEKKCRKIWAREVPFSPILAAAGSFINLWGLVVPHHSDCNVNTRRIRRVTRQCKVTKALS